MNEKTSTSAYMIESISLWHARLGDLNVSYIKNMQSLDLISSLDSNNINKCEICVKIKITKKSHYSVNRETEFLSLIHTDLGDLKQIMTRGGKQYYLTFIDDFSRYTKLYLLRSKDDAFNAFISYKTKVENQLSRKIKKIRSDRVGEYLSLNTFL